MERSSRHAVRITPVRTGARCPEPSAHQGGRGGRCLEVEDDPLHPALRRLATAVIRAGGTDLGRTAYIPTADIRTADIRTADIATAQRQALTNWRLRREVFSDLELLVLEYAEAVTAAPPLVPGELAKALIERLGHRQLVELTVVVAMERVRARMESVDRVTGGGGGCALASTP